MLAQTEMVDTVIDEQHIEDVVPFHPDFLGEMCRHLALTPYPNVQQFVVQHLFADTVRLLQKLHQYIPITTVIGISYSGNQASVDLLRSMGIRVLTPSYEELAQTVSVELKQMIAQSKVNNTRIVIHEVGGIAIKALHEPYYIGEDRVIGALEITKQGVWVAQQLTDLKIPQLNVAQTRLKMIEGKLVGEAVVSALDNILRQLGYATVGRDALVCGYGWVGKGVAQSLRQRGMAVSVMDIDTVSVVEAAVDGHQAQTAKILSRKPAIVIGASGSCSITADLIDELPDRCFLVSGASKNHEIDLNYLAQQAKNTVVIHEYVKQYTLHDGRRLYLVNEGYPVNFTGASVPDEIVEFLFAELIMLVPKLMEDNLAPGIYTLPPEEEVLPARIWLQLR
jgi:adenosylhomocysteinase